jgi:hypothetical protein
MFQFHGWAVVRHHTHDTNSVEQDQCWLLLENYIRLLSTQLIQTQRQNGCDSVLIAGQHNHRNEYVIDLFKWIAENAPGSYGILYIRDDEDSKRGYDFTNEFRVWKLCRGILIEQEDPFLSPCIPTVEDPFDSNLDD